MFLVDGRLFVRRDDGTVGEADAAERDYAYFVLDFLETVALHQGREMSPASNS